MADIGSFNLGYWLYMNEESGTNTVNTRHGRINSLGKELNDRGYAGQVVPHDLFSSLLSKYNLQDITSEEIDYIERKWL